MQGYSGYGAKYIPMVERRTWNRLETISSDEVQSVEGLPRPERHKETEPREEEDAPIHVIGVQAGN